ncbi:MAG: ribosomal RNA small subunit methyltransferase A [Proteobacteria bacterium]|nr:ribosomal RNA small subunit methyltransferase A [Pseudomonadota bacterium]
MPIDYKRSQKLPAMPHITKNMGREAKKALGQHFLIDEHIADTLVRSVPEIKDGLVLEIGPGPGPLTKVLLASSAAHIVAVELDKGLYDALKPVADVSNGRFRLIHQDAMQLDEAQLLSEMQAYISFRGGDLEKVEKMHIIANLPYNIGTALISKWLKEPQLFASITVMLQKEVADRLSAEPGTSSYGRLSILTQMQCEVYEVCAVPRESFMPPPKVTSAVIRLNPRQELLFAVDMSKLEKLVNLAFSQRRKMLRSSLKPLFPEISSVLNSCGIKDTARPEELSIEDFCKLVGHAS